MAQRDFASKPKDSNTRSHLQNAKRGAHLSK